MIQRLFALTTAIWHSHHAGQPVLRSLTAYACLNQRMIKVYDRLDDDSRVVNESETAAARDMQERISERFGTWLWEEPERARRATARYNELFNGYVAPSYTGDHLTFPGLAATFVPHPHQRAAVARVLTDGRALLAHAVGAGKTATMVMAGMELRRLGLVNRPAHVVPNLLLGSETNAQVVAV